MRPQKITMRQWSSRFALIDDSTIRRFCYYHNPDWGRYLSPPATFMVYGARELRKLKFDNSLAALRLWGFVLNESERLFRARQSGRKVVATTGDLGTVPIIVQAFPGCVPFYPECVWWTPFMNESTVLLDAASELGAPEAACFSKAALAAFHRRAYFPTPDLIIASTGASCDDFSCVMQLVEDLGHEVFWIEIPYRRGPREYLRADAYAETGGGPSYPTRVVDYLANEYRRVWQRMAQLAGGSDEAHLLESIDKANRLRTVVEQIKQLVYKAEAAPLPALEMMVLEFGNLYGYADLQEWSDIVDMLHETVAERVAAGQGILLPDAVPIAWITPSPEPLLLNLVEDVGCRVAATEYVIGQALTPIGAGEPFTSLAGSFLNASLIGSTRERIQRIARLVEDGRIAGVLITNMLGASHCAMETRLIEEMLGTVPVLSLDVAAPAGITGQMRTRVEAFVETIGCARL